MLTVDRALGFRDHAQRLGIEGDVGKPQAGDVGRHPHAVLVLLEIGDRGGDLLLRIGGERLEVDGRLLGQRLLQMRHRRARRGPEQSERRLRFDGELDIGQPQRLLRLVEHRPAPDMHGGFAAETEEALLLLGVDQQRDQQPVAGRRHGRALDGDVDRARAVLRKGAPGELRLDDLVDLGKGHVDRHADADPPGVGGTMRSSRKRAIGLGLRRRDAGLGLDAERQRHRGCIDTRLRRDRAGRLQLQPQRRQRRGRAGALQRNRAAGLGPLRPRIVLEGRIVADPRLHRVELVGDRLVDHRLDLRRHVDARARHRKAGVAQIDLRRQIGLDAPGGGKLRPRGDGDVALDLGAGVEVLDVDAADLLGDIAAEQAAERVADRAGCLGVSEPVTFSVPVSGVASDSTSWAPVAVIGPREAVQPISAFCRICDTGLSALPAKLRGAPRSAASRIAVSAIATGAMMLELRGAGGSGGNSTSTGALTCRAAHSQSMAFRLTKNETAITATAIRIVLRCTADASSPRTIEPRSVYRAGRGGARVRRMSAVKNAGLRIRIRGRRRTRSRCRDSAENKRGAPNRRYVSLTGLFAIYRWIMLADGRAEIGAAISSAARSPWCRR